MERNGSSVSTPPLESLRSLSSQQRICALFLHLLWAFKERTFNSFGFSENDSRRWGRGGRGEGTWEGGTGRGAQFLRSQHPAPRNETEDLYLFEQTRAFGLSSVCGDQGVRRVGGVVMMGGGVGIHPFPPPPPPPAQVFVISLQPTHRRVRREEVPFVDAAYLSTRSNYPSGRFATLDSIFVASEPAGEGPQIQLRVHPRRLAFARTRLARVKNSIQLHAALRSLS